VLPAGADEPDHGPWRSLAGFGRNDVSTSAGDVDRVIYDS
jgi:hypothetical protein